MERASGLLSNWKRDLSTTKRSMMRPKFINGTYTITDATSVLPTFMHYRLVSPLGCVNAAQQLIRTRATSFCPSNHYAIKLGLRHRYRFTWLAVNINAWRPSPSDQFVVGEVFNGSLQIAVAVPVAISHRAA